MIAANCKCGIFKLAHKRNDAGRIWSLIYQIPQQNQLVLSVVEVYNTHEQFKLKASMNIAYDDDTCACTNVQCLVQLRRADGH